MPGGAKSLRSLVSHTHGSGICCGSIKTMNCCYYFAEPDKVLLCIELCCKFNLSDKCLQLCSFSGLPSSGKLFLCKGKSLFDAYRKEQSYLDRHTISASSDQKLIQRRKSCYDKAENCIKFLGAAFDQDCIDPEGSKMLDIAMLNFIRETNKLNNIKRCLLCRKKRNLKKSHLWPKSFLRRYIGSRGYDSASKVYISFDSLRPREKSPGEVTYWMLCGECEQRLCQNGEGKFISEIYDVVSSISENGIKISYGPWLYSFSLGLVFRIFIYFRGEAIEQYMIFQQCREHLLKLPVKYMSRDNKPAEHEESISPLQREKMNVELDIPVVLLANPTKINVDHPRKSMLIGALFNAGTAHMSGHYLSTGKRDLTGQMHFIVVLLGDLNFLLPLSASNDYSPPTGSLIDPQGGELFVPSEDCRWNLIPEGLWMAIANIAKVIEETSLYHYTYRSKSGNWKPISAEEQERPCTSKELSDEEKLLYKSLKDSSSSSKPISKFLNAAFPSLSFLPDEIKLLQRHKYTQEGFLQLPSSHIVLIHENFNLAEDSFTLFLVTKSEDESFTLSTYVIFVERYCGVQISYGAYVHADTNHKVCIGDSLINMKGFSQHHIGRFEYYCEMVEKMLPLILKRNGFKNVKEIIQRAEITR